MSKLTDKSLFEIANQFLMEDEIESITPINSGLINQTYLLKTKNEAPDYILQKKNKKIFRNVPAMMENILKVTEHIRCKVKAENGDTEREVLKVILTLSGQPWHMDEKGEFWTLIQYIPDTLTFENISSPEYAYKGGQGIGKFHLQLSDFKQPLNQTIEGFHDLGYRLRQWDELLKNANQERLKETWEEINWIERRRNKMQEFWQLVENGILPKRVTHNDTKLSNILFDKKGNVLCVIDLDTVMTNTPLADYGDAIRSFANTGKEDDTDLENVGLDTEKYKAYTEGYLSYAKEILNGKELEYLSFAPQYVTYEQVMRFLMDYLQNDIYYKIDYPKHNLVRTRAQMKLLESMENYENENK